MSKYLLEIGTEELPYKFIPQAIEQLHSGFENFLNNNKIGFEKVDVYATPRRLAVIVSGLVEKSEDEIKVVKGPIAKIAYDENGSLTKAGEGFAKKNGVAPEDLYVEDNYVHAKIVVKGKSIVELLKENVPVIFSKLQGAHFMRWGYNDQKFSRPIKWIVSLLDKEEVEVKIIDKVSSNVSRGHRFAQQNVIIGHPDDYVEIMRNCCVIVDQNERKQIIIEKAKSEAAKLGAEPYYTDDLLDEVTFITEYPVPATCEFSDEYLKLPEELVVTVMAVHQRYFALYKDGKLINKFITMTNYIGDEFANIKAGNVRVIKARLDDAVFFFNEDTKKPLKDYVEDLKGVTFQKGMGTVYDKTQRIISLSKDIAKELGAASADIERTALLCKADLVTQLVFEFTELQGYIGSDYARVSGENEKVVEGIKEHYFPLNAESETAKGIEGQVVGIADKLDTICAVFADGKKPTGSSDPLGVRRAALGIIRTILDNNLKVNVADLIRKDMLLLPVSIETSPEKNALQKIADTVKKNVARIVPKQCPQEINEFFVQRLIIFLSDKYNKNVLEACASNKNPMEDLADYIERVKVVSTLDNPALLEAANRVIRILKEDSKSQVNRDLFKETSEGMLYREIQTVDENADYTTYLNQLIAINPAVEKFFEDVLVMDKDEKVKENRLALLTMLKKKYEKLTDFSKL
ncbi:TPA: glycine--tRNA ligase subunit beta [Candidatus Scatousia excrementigallinarum]|uniref:Glycine--tRNA ligase beta subunit n=1 Tax=Candidatus Scatousia excrementigallinarum TaxID=2840935 RepID=A0A9D1JN17_9BACT|nr:glycine--tRNA ligase subunit beta [Candidatus Scatousia excrementigallinarum]